MKLIVGLGNPGREYKDTRHNIGYSAIERIAESLNVTFDKKKFTGIYAEISYNDEKVILLKPEKYMNLSGEVIRDYVSYFKIDMKDILIIYDDLDTPVGMYRLRYSGGSGGHNGIKDIEHNLGTSDYNRIRIGISKDSNFETRDYVLGKFSNFETRDYVLGKFSKEEKPLIDKVLDDIVPIFKDYFILSFDNLMNKYNGK